MKKILVTVTLVGSLVVLSGCNLKETVEAPGPYGTPPAEETTALVLMLNN